MVVAASEWEADVQMVANGNLTTLAHFRVITMDSAFVHTRSLYEFFIDTGSVKADTYSAIRDFGVSIGPTPAYTRWINALNKRVFHLDIYRPKPVKNNGSVIPGVKIKNEVTHLAQDVLDLWDQFTNQAPMYSRLLRSRRSMAIKDAAEAARSRGITTPVFK